MPTLHPMSAGSATLWTPVDPFRVCPGWMGSAALGHVSSRCAWSRSMHLHLRGTQRGLNAGDLLGIDIAIAVHAQDPGQVLPSSG